MLWVLAASAPSDLCLTHCCFSLQVARIEDNILVATSSSTGSVCMLLMQLPPVPQATSADLQVHRAGAICPMSLVTVLMLHAHHSHKVSTDRSTAFIHSASTAARLCHTQQFCPAGS